MLAELSLLCLSEELKYREYLRGELPNPEAFFSLKDEPKAAQFKVLFWLCFIAASFINIYTLHVFQTRKPVREWDLVGLPAKLTSEFSDQK